MAAHAAGLARHPRHVPARGCCGRVLLPAQVCLLHALLLCFCWLLYGYALRFKSGLPLLMAGATCRGWPSTGGTTRCLW